MKKFGYRTSPIVQREGNGIENSNWMQQFADSLSRNAVQPMRHEDNLFDQISSIINSHHPKYPSVEAAVQDMQERSGLRAYQAKIKSLAEEVKKRAACEPDKETKVKVFTIKPEIQQTFDNYIQDTKGNISLPAVIDRVKSIHRNDIVDDAAWNDDDLLKYVNDKTTEVKKMFPDLNHDAANLGRMTHFNDQDIDPSNQDALFSLTPAVVK